MDEDTIATHLENLDHRLGRVEQILPTLATKEALRAAIAPLATKEELHREIREEGDRLRRHMTVLFEHQDGKIQLLAEHVLSLMPKQPEK